MSGRLSTLALFSCLTVAVAVYPNCSVSKSDEGQLTTYTIEDMSRHVPANATCHFSWSDDTERVFANQLDYDRELVKESSARCLVTRKCLDVVLYEFSCGPKWQKITGECKVACAELLVLSVEVTPGQHVIVTAAIGVTITVFVVVLLFALMRWKQKSHISQYWTMLTKKMRRDGPATVENGQQVPLNDLPV